MNLSTVKIQVQKQIFTASLEKSIAMLILPHSELANSIEEELQNNPLLEADSETSSLDQISAIINLPNINRSNISKVEKIENESSSISSMMSLEDHLFQQLFWEISDPLKRHIGNFIIGNLDKDGFLELTCEEIVEELKINDIALIKEVLNTIQHFDPMGVATKDFRECLIVQLQSNQSPYCKLAIRIVEEFLEYLGDKRFSALSKKLGVSLEDISQAEILIASLEPKPSRNYRPHEMNIYVEPDIYLRKNEVGEYIIETNKNGIPALRISQTYRHLLNQPNTSNEDRQFITEKITHALNYIKSIHLRGDTLTAIARYILNRQKGFFENENNSLVPMTLKDIAEHLQRNESTISRAISNKYMDTPQGLFSFKFFFTNKVSQQHLGDISAHCVKNELTQLIEEENKESPLSDQDIQDHFNAKGIHLARRTIAKYRQSLHIPASHLRK